WLCFLELQFECWLRFLKLQFEGKRIPSTHRIKPIRINVSSETLETAGPVIPDAVERRRSEREERRVPAWLSDASGGRQASSQQEVMVPNSSLHGVGFPAPRRLQKEDFHWIVIASDNLSLSTRLRVVSCRENPAGGFDVGAEFF